MKTILMINRNAFDRDDISRLLRESGYTVLGKEDGISSLETLRETDIDVIISDSDLPDMNILTFLSLVRRRFAGGPRVILLNDCVDMQLYLSAMSLGVYEFLFRPFHARELVRIVDRALTNGLVVRRNNKEMQSRINEIRRDVS